MRPNFALAKRDPDLNPGTAGGIQPASSRVLVIDADEGYCRMLAELLGADGHKVFRANDGERGIRMFFETWPDVVIADVAAPDRHAIQTIADLRDLQPDLKIIALSGGGVRADADALESALALGADVAVRKPLGADRLRRTVERCLGEGFSTEDWWPPMPPRIPQPVVGEAAPMAELKRITYVEDEPDVRTVAILALEQIGGFTLDVCGSGHEAIERTPAFRPDLILLDVMMPKMDGIETLARLKAIPELADTPVVFMTAKTQVHEVEGYKALGALDVIPKPFDPMSISDEVRAIWNRRDA